IVFKWLWWLKVEDSGHIGCTFGLTYRTVERRDNLSYGNFLGIVRQAIPTLDAAMRNQKSALQEDLQELAHSRQRQLGLRSQPPRRVQALVATFGDITHQDQPVIG